ncbi:hypothetical protein DCCM_0191 [Desulfocucumis palustris]|uniref:Uncharacterized protein n=1 Tax=Desulfocucumis palustris TaxID=1898651 RepID=A0A2L2X7M2_9FIRM|nr:hypothetical protein DCCM_0191 [Desulfocucumis palustris]
MEYLLILLNNKQLPKTAFRINVKNSRFDKATEPAAVVTGLTWEWDKTIIAS